ncbi:MAG: GEVED domain-containing protein [Ignavibacteria bacterium]|nr:GEVED domain-containing protein [Ignavibacteria bacterium]
MRPSSNHLSLLGSLFVAFLLAVFPFKSYSQPEGYCTVFPADPSGYTYVYQYCYGGMYYGYLTNVRIVDAGTGAVILDWSTGDNNCYTNTMQEAKLKLGKSYQLTFKFFMPYSWYCQYIRQYGYNSYCYGLAWLDWNMNARFSDANEFLGVQTLQLTQWDEATCTGTYGPFTINVPNTQQVGKTRLRVAHNMWGHYGGTGSTGCRLYYAYDYPPYLYYYAYGEAEDYILEFLPDIEATFPADGDVLRANVAYDGGAPDRPRPMLRMGSTQPSGAILRYRITGPRPSTSVVYEGLDPATGSIDINMGGFRQYNIQRARGSFAMANGGFLSNRGGEYVLTASVGGTAPPAETRASFTVAWDNDLSVNAVQSPRTNLAPRFTKYLRGQSIGVVVTFHNTGLNNITEFYGTVRIFDPSGTQVYNRTIHYDANNNPAHSPIAPGQKIDLTFPAFSSNTIGIFKIRVECDLRSAIDQEAFNNTFPRQGDPDYTFEIAYEFQVKANRVVRPALNQQLIGNRPIIPTGELKNEGIYLASEFPATLLFYRLPDSTNPVYSSTITITDIQSGRYNTKTFDFDVFIPRLSGNYMAKLIAQHPEDPVREDDTVRSYFTVLGGLAGVYQVGSGQRFPTIDSAMNALYYFGLAGNVVFELTDSYYQVTARTSVEPNAPAWDFRGMILALGYNPDLNTTYTVTWRPSTQRSLTKGSITIDLVSPRTGVGIAFGQSLRISNPYSVYREYLAMGTISRRYVNSPGHIIFDGGSQKSIKLRLISGSRGGQAVYLGPGSSNITIKNLIIENGTSAIADRVWLPMTAYSPIYGFTYTPDTLLSGTQVFSYSAGVVSRAYIPFDEREREQFALMALDTLPNTNNVIEGNEIYGFGYGIVSLGFGQLWRGDNYVKYYNRNNTYANNTIYNVRRAGIFLGYEQNSQVIGNRIYNVNGGSEVAFGIALGGEGSSAYKGYNNINVTISQNEISGVSSNVGSFGIKVEQELNVLPHHLYGDVRYPDEPESITITNNTIWRITTGSGSAYRAGIALYTSRQPSSVPMTFFITPKVRDYHSRNDRIANNTVVISPNPGIVTTAPVFGVGILNSRGATFKNNAIALLDMNVDPNNPVYAGLFYQGMMPNEFGFVSDRNAFWYPSGSGGNVARFVELDKNNNVLDNAGNRNDFSTLEQWQNWTGQDFNSVFGNFTNDFVYLGFEPNQRLRIATNPAPIGSILNNRAERLSWVVGDIDGETRGAAGENYDIGADEFVGRLYLNDLEVLKITYPSKYQASTGLFNDAQYVMDNSPTNVRALVRNNGNLPQNGVNVTLNIFRELPNGTFSTTPEITTTQTINLTSGQSVELDFKLADGIAPDFRPKTYGELANQGYYVPDHFLTMQANVTPRYRIVVSLGSDQNNGNNQVSKVVRYYLPQSPMRVVFSVENSFVTLDANSTLDQIAGRLNYDSLLVAFRKVGLFIDIAEGIYRFDIFDRNGWEPRTVDYTLFKSLIWSDGNDKALTRFQKLDIRRFLTSGTTRLVRNFVASSQEFVRSNASDTEFLSQLFRAVHVSPGNPMGSGVSNHGNAVIGVATGKNLAFPIARTGYSADAVPLCGLMRVEPSGEGLALVAGYYQRRASTVTDSIAGIAISTPTRAVLLFGVDWRHWGNNDLVARAVMDYAEKVGGGLFIPVELTDFVAKPVGNAVHISWTTASEYNTDRFELERASLEGEFKSEFLKVTEEKAAGNSVSPRNYGPVVDRNVQFGKTYVYRLKVVDLDGSVSYSREQTVKMDGAVNWLGEIVPNPASNQVWFEMNISEGLPVSITLIDMSGRELKNVYTGLGKGNIEKVYFDVADLPSGVYTLVIKLEGETITRTINIVR